MNWRESTAEVLLGYTMVVAWLACIVLLWSCTPPAAAPTAPPVPLPAPGTEDADCFTVCEHLRDLGCEQAEPSPGGASCEDVCDNVQSSGVITWNLSCRASIADCNKLDHCER